MRRSKNVGVALVGLLVVAAISVAAASGRKPAREERAKTSVRVLTDVETDQLGRRFPGLRARVQITGELLERLFPRTAFYRALLKNRGVTPAYLTAISDSGPITMPDGFSRLLRVYNTEVNDENKVEMAKAFVLMAIGDEPNYDPETNYPTGLDSFPPVTFMDADVTEHRIGYLPYGVELKVKIGEHVEVWHFAILQGTFAEVVRRDPKGRTIEFYIPGRIVPPAGRSQHARSRTRTSRFAERAIRAESDSLGTGLASGSEPHEGQEAEASLRRLSASEVMEVLNEFPEMVPGYFATEKNNVGLLAKLFRFSEVTAAPLEAALPGVRFYKGLDGKKPPVPYLMAIAGGKRYLMPGDINWLLLDNGLEVNDKNVLEMARAFVILALGSKNVADPETGGYAEAELLSFPQITFLNAKRVEQVFSGRTYVASLKVRVRGQAEDWLFERWHNQFGSVARGNAKGLIHQYTVPEARPREQQK